MNNWKRLNLGELGKSYSGLNGKTKNDFGKGSPYIPYLRIFEDGKIDLSRMDYVSIDKHERQNSVQVGDLFFTTSSETINEVGMTSVLIDKPTEKTYLNSFCFGFRLSNFDDLTPEYARYLFRSLKVRKDISLLGQGSTRYNLPKTILFKKLFVDVPDIPYQQKIAKILNTIDAVIEKTEHAIAKYQAIKKGMMHDLFTRGIDVKTGQLRPSFDDAPELYKKSVLGMIPKDWEVEELGNLVKGRGVYGINAAAVNYDPELFTYLRITDISEDGCFISEGKKSVNDKEAKNFLLEKGDIVFARTGNSTGKTYLYNENDGILVFAGFLIRFKPDNELLISEYLKFYTETEKYWNWVSIYSMRTGQPGINGLEYGKLPLPKPSLKEQELISKRLLAINKKIQVENESLKKYQNIKKGLMQDLLTGKVKVKV